MRPFSLAKQLLARCGIRAYRTAHLPRNIDPLLDLKKLHFNPIVIFDVGANVGQFGQAAMEMFPSATMHSFEPIAETYRSLQQTASRYPHWVPHHLAFGAEPGTATIHLRANSVWNSLLPYNNDPSNSAGQSQSVTIATIDNFCQENAISAIDLLKTDTEGFDLKVLQGAGRMFKDGKIGAVYSEVTFLESDQTHTQFFDILAFLRPYNFVLYGIYEVAGDFTTMHGNALFLRRPKQA